MTFEQHCKKQCDMIELDRVWQLASKSDGAASHGPKSIVISVGSEC